MRNRRQAKIKAAADVSSDGVETGEDGVPETVSTDSEKPASYGETNMEALGESPVVLDIECGPNKAKFYLDKVQMGSKGQCVFFEDSWLTPNEFQFVSGRETAKDWKRSIKHHDKSLKLLMSRGLLSLSPAECRCEHCTEGSTSVPEKGEDSERENVPPSSEGCPSPQEDYNSSPNNTVNDMTAEQDRTQSRDIISGTEGHKTKSKKRRRDASPKAKGKRRAKKQRRSQDTSEGEKNVLKLKRMEDSEVYVSSVLYSPENTLKDKETAGSGDTNTAQGEKKQDAHLSAYDEDTDSYVNDTEVEDETADAPNKSTPAVDTPLDHTKESTDLVSKPDKDVLPPRVESVDVPLAVDGHTVKAHKKEPGYGKLSPVPTEPVLCPKITKGRTETKENTETTEEKMDCKQDLMTTNKKRELDIPVVESGPLSLTKHESRLQTNLFSLQPEPAKCKAVDLSRNETKLDTYVERDAHIAVKDRQPRAARTEEPLNMKLSPQKESRLTNIIEQLRTYKRQLDQKTCRDGKTASAPRLSPIPLVERKSPSLVHSAPAPLPPSPTETTPVCNGEPRAAPWEKEERLPPKSTETTPVCYGEPRGTSSPKPHGPSTLPSPGMDYYQLLKSHAEAIRKAESRDKEKTSHKNKDQTDSKPDKTTLHKSHKSGKRKSEGHKHVARADSAAISREREDAISGLPTSAAALSELNASFPGSMGLPYMAYPYLHPGLVQGSGITAPAGLPTAPSTTVSPEALASPMLYSSLYGMYPTLAASLGAGGLEATGFHPQPKMAHDLSNGTSSSKSHSKSENKHAQQPADTEKNAKYPSNFNSYNSPRYSLSGTVDYSRKTEYAYDKNGALDLTSSHRRSAESKAAPKAKRSRVVDHHYNYKSREAYDHSTGDATSQGHREGQGQNHREGQYRKDSYKVGASERPLEQVSRKSVASVSNPSVSKVSSPSVASLSSVSSPSVASMKSVSGQSLASSSSPVAGVSNASLTAAMANAHAAALAHGYPSGSPYAAALAAGINPAAFGLMQHPFMYPYSM